LNRKEDGSTLASKFGKFLKGSKGQLDLWNDHQSVKMRVAMCVVVVAGIEGFVDDQDSEG